MLSGCRVMYDLLFFFSVQDGSKVFTASCDKTAKMWDLNSNQAIQIAQVGTETQNNCVDMNEAESCYSSHYFSP